VLEAIRAGCYPLLPADLSYPELYGKEFLYEPGRLAQHLRPLLLNPVRLEREKTKAMTARFDWQSCGEHYQRWLFAHQREGK
ncbi:MAG: DUF3524 domain-containing protein, partial [Thermodesulfobacteriota bacterium]